MDKLTDDQLEALFKAGHADSLSTGLRSVYEAGVSWGWNNPLTVVIDAPAAPVADPAPTPVES